ncbi:MAG: RusA family crossover junction endodeoxyribonuclease [Candidatus Anstonellales archaeon]
MSERTQMATVSMQNVPCISFTVDVMPVPQARPRFYVKQHGFKHFVGAYDPERCKRFKEVIAWHAKIKAVEFGLKDPLKGAISISLTFQMGRNGKEVMHTKKPDLDNLAKAVKDALKGIIYQDDSQIVEAHLYKRYGVPLIKISISEVKK